jgi:hypothetical protein
MSSTREIKQNIRSEIQAIATEFSSEFADKLPENNYWAFSLYTQIIPVILGEVTSFVLPQTSAAGPVWNYLDAASSAITGVNQLLDDTSHRPVATKIKGLVNMGTAGQLITLTALNFTLLGGPGFAAAFGAGFLLSLDETARAIGRKYNFEYWLNDSLTQLEKLAELKIKLKKEMDLLQQAEGVLAASWAYKRKKERCEKLASDQAELERDILFRVAAKRFECIEKSASSQSGMVIQYEGNAVIDKQLKARSEAFQQTGFMQDLHTINNSLELYPNDLHKQGLVSELKNACLPDMRKKREMEITKKCNDHVGSTVKDSLIWGVAFAGVLLACIPGCQLAALIVIGAASAMYLAKNSNKLCGGIKKGFNYLFSSSKKHAANNSDDSEHANLLVSNRVV